MSQLYFNNKIFYENLSRPDFAVLCSRRALAHAIKNGVSERRSLPRLPQDFVVLNYGRFNNSMDWSFDVVEGEIVDGAEKWSSIMAKIKRFLKGKVSE